MYDGYVILENHLQLIAASPDLSRDMQRFKAYTAKQIIAYLQQSSSGRVLELLALLKRPHKIESEYQVWEEGSHPQLIDSEAVMRQKLDYIHRNPVERGYVDLPEHWRYSSAKLCWVGRFDRGGSGLVIGSGSWSFLAVGYQAGVWELKGPDRDRLALAFHAA